MRYRRYKRYKVTDVTGVEIESRVNVKRCRQETRAQIEDERRSRQESCGAQKAQNARQILARDEIPGIQKKAAARHCNPALHPGGARHPASSADRRPLCIAKRSECVD